MEKTYRMMYTGMLFSRLLISAKLTVTQSFIYIELWILSVS